MASLRKSPACLLLALSLLIALASFAAQNTSNSAAESLSEKSGLGIANEIILETYNPQIFNFYNTNGTPPFRNNSAIFFYGSNRTNVYSDAVSYTTLNAEKTLTLQAQVTVNMENFSNGAEDQFAIFATDDIIKYKSDEFGFVLPETENLWYAYIQSPSVPGFFIWEPVLTVEPSKLKAHSLEAVYIKHDYGQFVEFFVDGKLAWRTLFPDVSGREFHLVLTSHKVSPEHVDLSGNYMAVENARFRGNAEEITQQNSYQNLVALISLPILSLAAILLFVDWKPLRFFKNPRTE